jgi:predicted AlkP superfamily phosphohydrolase/phosphomutase
MMVEMGPDRLQHGFWRYCDPEHRLFEPGNKYEHVLHDYYLSIDEEIGRTVEAATAPRLWTAPSASMNGSSRRGISR